MESLIAMIANFYKSVLILLLKLYDNCKNRKTEWTKKEKSKLKKNNSKQTP